MNVCVDFKLTHHSLLFHSLSLSLCVSFHLLVCSYYMVELEMASSSSSTAPRIEYDIFLSFRGTDTRRVFIGHLVKALKDKQIETFVDYRLKEGTEISHSLLTAIEQSQISLIIFSKDYASSKWCLNELVKIIDCMKLNGQIAIPVFYDVDPSWVRKQKETYQNALAGLEKTSSEDEVQNWRKALNEAANLSGLTSSSFRNDAELIDEIVKRVLERLNQPCQSGLQGLVGIHEPVAEVESLLCRVSEAVLIIGLWGMGGIGKTTLASAVFNRLCHKFQGFCFLENVREGVEKHGSINHLKEELLSKLLGEKDANPYIMPNGITNFAKRRLCRKQVLVVLDDVSDSDQLVDLCGGHDWFGPTSRIIVTTRDRQVLVREADHIYEVKPLNFDESLQLFELNAFKRNYIQTEQVELPMTMRVVNYAEGVPLALKVLGSSLCGKCKEDWESQLSKLEKMPHVKIQKILRLSYDELDADDQNILLHLACYFETVAEEQVKDLLDSCRYSTAIGLRNLQDKALISISRSCVTMHDLIREMGRAIVRQESNEPGKRSRLWDPTDIYKVLKHNRGTEAIESITLNMSKTGELSLHPQVFARMNNLKFLNIHSWDKKNRLCAPRGIESLSNELRIFHWDEYPLKSLPLPFCAENLVEFIMPHSRLEKLWEGVQNLVNLKKVDVNWSSQLIQLPDFSKASNLKSINVSNCKSLCQVPSSAISSNKLAFLTLNDCEKLTSFQHNIHLESLMTLSLCDCSSLTELSLTASESPSSSTRLDSTNTLPTPLYKLSLDYCQNLSMLPENINMLSSLEDLSLCHSKVRTLPESIKHLSKLRCLNLTNCEELQSLPELPSSIEELIAVDCTSLATIFASNSMDELEEEQQQDETFAFANCMKLEEAAINTIVENALVRIKRAAHACLAATTDEYCVDGRRAVQTYYHRVRVCLPGRQVPSWFTYKTTQASMSTVTFKLVPPASPTSRFLGFILCIVLPQNGEKGGDLESLGCDYRVESSDGKSAPYGISNALTVFPPMFIWDNNRSDDQSVTYQSRWFLKHKLLEKEGMNNNVYLWYDGQCCLDIMRGMKQSKANGGGRVVHHSLKVSFRFYYVRGWKEHGMSIKQCGVHPIYASDVLNLGEQCQMESGLGIKSKRMQEDTTEGDLEEPLSSTNKKLKKE